MNKKLTTNTQTLRDAVKLYIVYLDALHMRPDLFKAHIRGLQHILTFYDYMLPLKDFSGDRVLQYGDIYDPYDFDPRAAEKGRVFWTMVHWLKRNELIPKWSTPKI